MNAADLTTLAAVSANVAALDALRAKKTAADEGRDLKSLLGCVGEPLALVLLDIVKRYDIGDVLHAELLDAATECRENLLHMVNEHRQSAAETAAEECHDLVSYLDCDDISTELDLDDSPNDAADKMAQHAAHTIANYCASASELTDPSEL